MPKESVTNSTNLEIDRQKMEMLLRKAFIGTFGEDFDVYEIADKYDLDHLPIPFSEDDERPLRTVHRSMYLFTDEQSRLQASYGYNPGTFYFELQEKEGRGFTKMAEYSMDQMDQIDPNLLKAAMQSLETDGYKEINARPRLLKADEQQELYPSNDERLSIAEATRRGLKPMVSSNGEEIE